MADSPIHGFEIVGSSDFSVRIVPAGISDKMTVSSVQVELASDNPHDFPDLGLFQGRRPGKRREDGVLQPVPVLLDAQQNFRLPRFRRETPFRGSAGKVFPDNGDSPDDEVPSGKDLIQDRGSFVWCMVGHVGGTPVRLYGLGSGS